VIGWIVVLGINEAGWTSRTNHAKVSCGNRLHSYYVSYVARRLATASIIPIQMNSRSSAIVGNKCTYNVVGTAKRKGVTLHILHQRPSAAQVYTARVIGWIISQQTARTPTNRPRTAYSTSTASKSRRIAYFAQKPASPPCWSVVGSLLTFRWSCDREEGIGNTYPRTKGSEICGEHIIVAVKCGSVARTSSRYEESLQYS
jgi:hypothetical protein